MKSLQRSMVALSACVAGGAQAHSGHGIPGDAHWHATDAAGVAFVVAAALIAWYLSGRE